jgi:3-oxoacyl-[acyl-carrier-protein] synthase II
VATGGVWITGLGAIGPQGVGFGALRQLIDTPRACFSSSPPDWAEMAGAPDAWIAPLDEAGEQIVRSTETVSTDRATALALIAAGEAWTHAGLHTAPDAAPETDRHRAGIYWGTGMGGLHTTETSYRRTMVERGLPRPMTVVRIMGNSAAAHLAIKYKLHGPNATYTVACASSAMALGEAMLAIRAGRIDLALVGGSEAMLMPGVMAAWGALRVLSTRKQVGEAQHACRPFGSARTGLVIGEGAAAMVLESERHARARSAKPLALLAGYGTTCDAGSLVLPQAPGQVAAMQQALADAGLSAAAIDTVNAHATGTDSGDIVEAQALAQVFGERSIPPISATKSMHGHLLGAAGAMEAAMGVATLQTQVVPATPGCDPLDARCGALPVHAQPQPRPMRHLLSNSFAFGGTNVSLILSAPES